jgi:hypothetical protein
VADLITGVLGATTPASGSSKAKYQLESAVAESSKKRCAELLGKHRLYPEIDLTRPA